MSQLSLIRRLDPFETQERFLTNESFLNLDLTKERIKRQIRFTKADTQRHYMMFFSKIANEKRERIEYEKTKNELEGRIWKLIDYLEKIRQKTEIIDGKRNRFEGENSFLSWLGSFDQSQLIDEDQFELFSKLVQELHLKINSDMFNKLEWLIQHGLSTSSTSIGVDVGLLPNTCQQINDLINKQEHSKTSCLLPHLHPLLPLFAVPNRISRLYPKFSENSSSSSSSSSSNGVGVLSLFEAANLCLEKRLGFHTASDENFAKLKLALEQMQTTIERSEQIQKTLDHLVHLPKHIQRTETEAAAGEIKTPYDQIATRFYPSIDCGQQARELFREQMSKQAPNSFVTCCNTIVTMSADETHSDFMNDDTTIIRCQVPPSSDDRMLKGLESLLLSEPMTTVIGKPGDDQSFLTLEQECEMESETFVERPQRKTTLETNVAAVIMDDRMEEDVVEKENRTPVQFEENPFQLGKLDDEIHYISPIISVPIEQ